MQKAVTRKIFFITDNVLVMPEQKKKVGVYCLGETFAGLLRAGKM